MGGRKKAFVSVIGFLVVFYLVRELSTPLSAGQSPVSPSSGASESCSLRSPNEWQHFLEQFASEPKWLETCEDDACDAKFYAFVKEKVQKTFESCGAFLDANPALRECTSHFRKFVPTWMRQHDSISYGFNVDNRTYLADQVSPLRPPGMMNVPTAIVDALPDRKNVEAAARDRGYQYLTHDSGLGGSRTFVLIADPQGRFDTWLLINLQQTGKLIESQPLSVLAVQKKDASGRPLRQVQIHFRDYTIERANQGYSLSLFEENNGKCYSCHVSGVRQLIARRTPILEALPVRGEPFYGQAEAPPDFAYLRLLEFNRRLRSYGMPDWEGKIVPQDHGPLLGKAQGCIDCHDGKIRGGLNLSTSHVQVVRKIVDQLDMPSDNQLPRLLEKAQMRSSQMTAQDKADLEQAFAHHEQLAEDFEASRGAALKQWILEKSCTQ